MEKPLLFVDCVDGKEETTAEGNSWLNPTEASQVVHIVQQLLCSPDIHGDIGVIAPYAAQVSTLNTINPQTQVTAISYSDIVVDVSIHY